jgi:hypothetical protein
MANTNWHLLEAIQKEHLDTLGPAEHQEILDGDFAILQVLHQNIEAFTTCSCIFRIDDILASSKYALLRCVYFNIVGIRCYPPDEHFEIHWRQWRNICLYMVLTERMKVHAYQLVDHVLKKFSKKVDRRLRQNNVRPLDTMEEKGVIDGMIHNIGELEGGIEVIRKGGRCYDVVPFEVLPWKIEEDDPAVHLFGVFFWESLLRWEEELLDLLDSYSAVSSSSHPRWHTDII